MEYLKRRYQEIGISLSIILLSASCNTIDESLSSQISSTSENSDSTENTEETNAGHSNNDNSITSDSQNSGLPQNVPNASTMNTPTQNMQMSPPTSTPLAPSNNTPAAPANNTAQNFVCDYYISPSGSSSKSGMIDSPWDLRSVLTRTSSSLAGKTICLREGVYQPGAVRVTLSGLSGMPVTLRRYKNEKVVIDANGSTSNFFSIVGSFIRIWGIEFTDTSASPNFITGVGVDGGQDVKIINCITHDFGGAGLNAWEDNTGAEIVGTASFYNGRNISARGYGIYIQNKTGSKLLEDNLFFTNFGSYNVHAYGQAGSLHNLSMKGNVSLSGVMMVGGTGVAAQNLVWDSNVLYRNSTDVHGSAAYLGYSAGLQNAVITNNIIPNGRVYWAYANNGISMTGNMFRGSFLYHYGTLDGVSPLINDFIQMNYPNNTYQINYNYPGNPPSFQGSKILYRANRYESGRGHIVVLNWNNSTSASLDLSKLNLKMGQSFEIKDMQNLLGTPIMTGIYDGKAITVPLTLNAVLAPRSLPAGSASEITEITHTSREFNVFVVNPLY